MTTAQPKVHTYEYDVVIVGAGGAGMRAAIEAGPHAKTAVISKLFPFYTQLSFSVSSPTSQSQPNKNYITATFSLFA